MTHDIAIARIRITIEPRWTLDIHRGEIELYERELDGKTPAEIEAYIDKLAADYVREECPYGWAVLEDDAVGDDTDGTP